MKRDMILLVLFFMTLATFVLCSCAQRPVRPFTAQEYQDLATEYCGRRPYAFDREGIQCFLPGELSSGHP